MEKRKRIKFLPGVGFAFSCAVVYMKGSAQEGYVPQTGFLLMSGA